MARVYTIEFANISVSAVQDLIAATATANMAFEVHEVAIGFLSTAIQNLRVSLKRLPVTVTAGSGGSAATPQKTNNGDAAATVTGRVNDTTQATTSGTPSIVRGDVINTVNGFLYQPAKDDRIVIAPSQAFIVSLDTAPSSAINVSGTLTFAELF